MRKRVVVTGYGVVNCLGKNKEEFKENLFAGKSGISTKIMKFKDKDVKGSVGFLPIEEEHSFFKENDLPYDKCAQLALMASEECINQADIQKEEIDAFRKGICIGTSLGGMLSGDKFHTQWIEEGIENADSNLLKQYPLHAITDIIAKRFGFNGIKNVISTACSAGSNAIGYGFDMIRSGKYDVMLVGGVDPLSRFSFSGFTSLKALDPDPCKPYSNSHGINLGEGAGFLLLEDYEQAKKRGAHIIAEISGYGLSADAYHQTAPDLGGGGAIRAMKAAIDISGLEVSDISYVNGHGTGTVANDVAESRAFKNLFGEYLDQIPLSSIKGAIGHCLGAAGAIEGVASVMAIENDTLPPTVNFNEENKKEINHIPNKAQKIECKNAVSNSFAFGGNNCSVIFSKLREEDTTRPMEKKDIVITGIGCMGVGGTSIEELWKTFDERKSCIEDIEDPEFKTKWMGTMPEAKWKKYIPPKFIRRVDEVTKMAMASGKQALVDSKIKVTRSNMDNIGVIYATGTGPLQTIEMINRSIIEEGVEAVNPIYFPNSVINAAPGNFCIANMLKGATSTLSAGGISTLAAFNYAVELLRSNQAEAIIVLGADECNKPMLVGNDKMDLLSTNKAIPLAKDASGMIISPGSTAFVLETEEHAKERNAKVYAKVLGYSMTSDNSPLTKISVEGKELEKCIRLSMEESGLSKVDYYATSANGVKDVDEAEANVINNMFSDDTEVSSIQALLGCTSGSVGGYGILSALYAFEKNKAVALPDGEYDLVDKIKDKIVLSEAKEKEIKTACISANAFGGSYASVIIEKAE